MRAHLLPTALLSLLLTTSTNAADLTFTIPSTPLLAAPSTLLPSTRATLFKHNGTLSVPLSRRNTFDFSGVAAGSYLFTVQCRDYAFGPLRVDVDVSGDGAEGGAVDVWQTFWGNEWGNKGERRAECRGAKVCEVEVKPERAKEYYMQRAGFDPISFLKNPMILMALVSLAMIVGLPYLTENMDDETRAEFEEMQRTSTLSKAAGAASQGGLHNFDLAGFLAGSGKPGGEREKSS